MPMISPFRSGEPGSGKTRTARLWVYVRDDRNAGSQMPPAVWFAYSPDRKGIHPQNHLSGYSGVLPGRCLRWLPGVIRIRQNNGSCVYGPCPEKNPRCACKAPTDITTEALQRIGELYAIEAEVRAVQQNSVWRQEKPERPP